MKAKHIWFIANSVKTSEVWATDPFCRNVKMIAPTYHRKYKALQWKLNVTRKCTGSGRTCQVRLVPRSEYRIAPLVRILREWHLLLRNALNMTSIKGITVNLLSPSYMCS
jgi:hypothetical protein